MRTGVMAKKIGMTRVYNANREHNSVTVLKIPFSTVIGHKKTETDGYNALILGFEKINSKYLKKPQKEFFSKIKQESLRKIKEFRVSEDNFVEKGKSLTSSHFVVGQYVDVRSDSIGKGFAGAMKRHNFAGLRASHGVSISHRSHGSTGNSQDPGRVWKGKKMAGQMGNKKTTVQSLEVVSVDEERSLILVKGGVPGSIGGWVEITDAKKKSLPANVPYPAGTKGNNKDNKEVESSLGQLDKNIQNEEQKVVEEPISSVDTNDNNKPSDNTKKDK
ncbi:MAG: 50S ribosomal protein L3 [Pelagibacterales bacterium]|nr:50S ribosomal protein L3 [Pelagibacterales bacterium]OUU62152.1 MAG: 50S ribosomal protein L3 [Alphaproteobacteria bacterium TMED62]|tara:strand:- start:20744 stop:21568 length:825 start_codon:yes stop_codon:yes gene_type:complete